MRLFLSSFLLSAFVLLTGCGRSSSPANSQGSDKDSGDPKTDPKTEQPAEISLSVPMTHILICCRSSNEGVIKFKVGDQWITDHSYKNIDHARAILSTIKAAGINDVIIDLTNPSQWATEPASWPGCQPNENALWNVETKDILTTIEQVCGELGMHFVMFIGNPAAHTMAYWNGIAEQIWNTWAQKDVYRKYGFGDDRPMLVVFYPGEDFKAMYDNTPEGDKDYLAKFRIGTCQVNDPITFTRTDGWGYRNKSESSDHKVRFVAPNEGVNPSQWKRSTLDQWIDKVEWAGKATEYTIFGSYDDTCDAIFWGIADTSESQTEHKRYPGGEEPDAYYNVVKQYLQNRNQASE